MKTPQQDFLERLTDPTRSNLETAVRAFGDEYGARIHDIQIWDRVKNNVWNVELFAYSTSYLRELSPLFEEHLFKYCRCRSVYRETFRDNFRQQGSPSLIYRLVYND